MILNIIYSDPSLSVLSLSLKYLKSFIKPRFFKKTSSLLLFALLSLGILVSPSLLIAEEGSPITPLPNRVHEVVIGETELSLNRALNAFDGALEVGLPAGQLKAASSVVLTELNESITPPTGLTLVGPMYQIDMPAASFNAGRFFVSIKSSESSNYKQLYFYDKNHPGGWRPLPSNENFGKKVVSSYITFPFTRIAMFESPGVLVKGKASWYRHRGGLFAASPDFPLGTRLRVINTGNWKSVDVVVNDHGPNRGVHPDRVVDLDAVAFGVIAGLGEGVVNVAVEKLPDHIPSRSPGGAVVAASVLSGENSSSSLPVKAKAAMVLNSADNSILWSKGAEQVLPMASLTKLIALKVFMDTRPDLNRVVSYSVKDEELNHLYVPAGQSARLRLQEGDQLPIRDLVNSSLVGSTNNTVESLVRVSGLTREAFIMRMNALVREWGARQTRFVEPTGLSKDNITTASEYAMIARLVWLDPFIASASVLPSYGLTTLNTKRFHSFKNTNSLAHGQDRSILGSKTGFINASGHCLATKWSTDKNKNVIVVVLGSPTRQASLDDTLALTNFARQHIQ